MYEEEEKPLVLPQDTMMSCMQAWYGITLFRRIIKKEEKEEGEKEATVGDPSGISSFGGTLKRAEEESEEEE